MDTGAAGSAYFTGNAHDAYIASTPTTLGPLQLTAGRRRYPWSEVDDHWNLGLWQPRLRWDYLRQEQLGLTGFFADLEFDHGGDTSVRLIALATPFLIPELGNGTTEPVDGKFTTPNNRWQSTPSATAIYQGERTPLYYAVAPYKISDIVLNPGAAVRLSIEQRREGPYVGTAYAYKPMNQIQLGYDGNLSLYKQTGIDVPIKLNPYVYYHHLMGVDGGYRDRSFRAWSSILFESPDRPSIPDSVTYQSSREAFVLSGGIDKEFFGEGLDALRVGGSYLRVIAGNDQDRGPLAKSGVTNFENRYPFAGAFSVSASSPFPGFRGRTLSISSGLIYDHVTTAAILNVQLRSSPIGRLSLVIGADVLGNDAPITDTSTSNWTLKYRNNDRVYGGIHYVF